MMLRIIFAGTPEVSVPTLTALAASPHQVVHVLTQPDRPAGRGRKIKTSAIKNFAQAHEIPICQAKTLNDPSTIDLICSLQPDLIVVVAYGLLIPDTVLPIPKFGCINVHFSLLPRWRGAAPVEHALLAGDNITGITLMQIDSGLDTGGILKQATLNIHREDTTHSLHARLATLGAETLLASLDDITDGKLIPQTQSEDNVNYANKITKEAACINWQLDAQQIERMIRAFNPQPVAFTNIKGRILRLWKAKVLAGQLTDAPPGMIIGADKNGVDVACGNGILQIKELQWASGKRQTVQTALNAYNHPLLIGVLFDKH
jgi:methionyl-tRNA formyltransferase